MIEIVDIHKTFEDHYVLRGVNLSVNKGEKLVIIGRSGCGKSLLLKHVIGLMRPDKGQLFVNGEDVCSCSQQRLDELRLKISMLFQGAALFDSLSVEENVAFPLTEHTKKTKEEIAAIVDEKLRLVGLAGIGRLKPAELSGGMKKRIGLARAIAHDPEIILYDEPTTGLDPIMADIINDLIIDLNAKLKVTSIVVTHDMTSAYKIADRIAMLYEGEIIGIGTPDEI
ncbi:MAG: ABC transporter ATP-binding protein, partial [Candidatus Omnitrophica bacterium]|nr:ABC transporter ATP-binding protein [Candidatus Omnitrophota bacterium]